MKIFIGSSSEAADKTDPNKNVLLKIAGILRDAGAEPVLWNSVPSVFKVSNTTIEDLEQLIERENIKASIFIYSADDKSWSRGDVKSVPRDNVVFEHGLFTGILGRKKTITIRVGDIKIPSDLYGVKYIDYSGNQENAVLEIMGWVRELRSAYDIQTDIDNTKEKEIDTIPTIIEGEKLSHEKKHIIELIYIPIGGTYNTTKDSQKNTIEESFSISKNLITQSLYSSIMGHNPSFFEGTDLPVENITFFDAIRFCNKLSVKEDLQEVYTITNDRIIWNKKAVGYRLPFEIEWEYVLGYNDREITDNLDEIAWYRNNSMDETHEVGRKSKNKFGIYDLLGNVWEWCSDSKGNGKLRVLRGGSFADFRAQFTTQGFRKEKNESLNSKDVGFRVILQNNIYN